MNLGEEVAVAHGILEIEVCCRASGDMHPA